MKMIFDLYSTCGGKMPYDEYRKWYDKNDMVYVVLVDEKIYTKCHRNELFDNGLHYGCFIEDLPFDTPELVEKNALETIKRFGCVFTTIDEFKTIEKRKENERVRKAFMIAEEMIANG